MSTPGVRLRAYFAPQANPYAGGDLDNAQRLGAALWALVFALMAGLLPLSRPDAAIGGAGWALAGVIIGLHGALALALGRRLVGSWRAMLLAAYASVAGIAVLEWLSGGAGAPYQNLLFMPVMFVAAIHPPRTTFAFLGVVLVAMASPFAYSGWEPALAGAVLVRFVTYTALSVLVGALMSGVRAQRLLHAAEEAHAREEARSDPLTGLGNRRAFDEAGERELAQARRRGLRLSLMLVDVEGFKQVNDRFGHLEGDRCLRQVAATIAGQVRRPDLVFRWGGDEFALLLPGTGADGAGTLGERLGETVAERCLRPDEEPVRVRFGVAEPEDAASITELVALADLHLTAASDRSPAGETAG